MKRYVSIIALLLTAALLTACGSGADTQSKEADAAVQTALPPEGIIYYSSARQAPAKPCWPAACRGFCHH